MFELIEKIKDGTILRIDGKEYHVLAKAKYVTETETHNWYSKILLDNHYVLVIAPFDSFMYFGYVGKTYPCMFPSPNSIVYEEKTFSKDAEDYQIVKELVFGDCLLMEGEVKYADYSSGDSLISLGIIMRTGERADVYATIIDKSRVCIVE